MRLALRVNGEAREAEIWEGDSLLEALREGLHLWGTKNACEQGECGSCTVMLDGVLVCACLTLAAACQGGSVTTIEGLGGDPLAQLIQEALVDSGGIQCGFCTPGFVVTMTDLLRRRPDCGEDEMKGALAGNLCRCTGYVRIFEAWRRARLQLA